MTITRTFTRLLLASALVASCSQQPIPKANVVRHGRDPGPNALVVTAAPVAPTICAEVPDAELTPCVERLEASLSRRFDRRLGRSEYRRADNALADAIVDRLCSERRNEKACGIHLELRIADDRQRMLNHRDACFAGGNPKDCAQLGWDEYESALNCMWIDSKNRLVEQQCSARGRKQGYVHLTRACGEGVKRACTKTAEIRASGDWAELRSLVP